MKTLFTKIKRAVSPVFSVLLNSQKCICIGGEVCVNFLNIYILRYLLVLHLSRYETKTLENTYGSLK